MAMSAAKPNAVGGWVDGSIAQGRFQQNAGLFRIDPNMTWGNQLISNDVQGGYYRLDYQSRQWLADVGIDEVRSVSGLGANTTFVTGDARYQLSRDWGVGSVANIEPHRRRHQLVAGRLRRSRRTPGAPAVRRPISPNSGRAATSRSRSNRDVVDAGRHPAQHFGVRRAHQRRHHQ